MSPDRKKWPLGSGSVDEEPWPGIGEVGTPTASGTVTLTQASVTTARPPQANGVLSWRSNKGPMAVVLVVDVSTLLGASAANPYAAEQLLFTQLSGLQLNTAQPAGALRIQYGFGTTLRTLECDLRSGSYQLPPCDVVQVDAFIYGLGPITAKVSAAVVPGRIANPARMTSSFRPTIAAAGSVTEVVPFGARWVSLAGGSPTGTGVGQPVLSLAQSSGGVFMLHDYVNGTFLSQPGQVVELATRAAFTIANGGASSALVTAKFFLEP